MKQRENKERMFSYQGKNFRGMFMATIDIEHLYKDYNDTVRAVSDFNLHIEDEEFIVLVGPSGCGKSTTLRMIAGLEDITAGQIKIDNDVQNNLHPKDRDIAMVFQNYALYPHMSVRENMAFGLKMKKIKQAEINQRVEDVAEIIGLTNYLDRLPKELSGGQRQRVALGRAIVRQPKVFLMDEPLSNLDAKLRGQTRAEIIHLTRKLGITTVYVTHDQVEAMTMADRIVIMDDGVIQQVGTPRELYLQPANLFVAGFMGSPAMNFVDVKVTEHGLEKEQEIIPVPDAILDQLTADGYGEKMVTLGVRPENVSRVEDSPEKYQEYKFTSKIHLAEMLGGETLIHFDMLGKGMIAKLFTMDPFYTGDMIDLCLDFDQVHFFDKETNESILVDSRSVSEESQEAPVLIKEDNR